MWMFKLLCENFLFLKNFITWQQEISIKTGDGSHKRGSLRAYSDDMDFL